MKVSLLTTSVLAAASTVSIASARAIKDPYSGSTDPYGPGFDNPYFKPDPRIGSKDPPKNNFKTCAPYTPDQGGRWARVGLPLKATQKEGGYIQYIGTGRPNGADTRFMATLSDFGVGNGSGITMAENLIDDSKLIPSDYQSKWVFSFYNGQSRSFWLSSQDGLCSRDAVGFFTKDVRDVQVYIRTG